MAGIGPDSLIPAILERRRQESEQYAKQNTKEDEITRDMKEIQEMKKKIAHLHRIKELEAAERLRVLRQRVDEEKKEEADEELKIYIKTQERLKALKQKQEQEEWEELEKRMNKLRGPHFKKQKSKKTVSRKKVVKKSVSRKKVVKKSMKC